MSRSNGPGRPKSPDAKRAMWCVRLGEDESAAAEALIAERGLSRSAWLQHLVTSALAARSQHQVPAGRPRGTAPVAAEFARERVRDQLEDDCPHPKASVIKGRCSRCQTFVGF